MGIFILKYISQLLQVLSLILWMGSLVIILFVVFPEYKLNKSENSRMDFLINIFHRIDYVFLFSILFIWSGILINLLYSASNPLTSKLYVVYVILVGLASIISMIKIFIVEKTIRKIDKSLKFFVKEDYFELLKFRRDNFINAYYYLTILNLLIGSVIILLNQY